MFRPTLAFRLASLAVLLCATGCSEAVRSSDEATAINPVRGRALPANKTPSNRRRTGGEGSEGGSGMRRVHEPGNGRSVTGR